jgi:hypothetical protein
MFISDSVHLICSHFKAVANNRVNFRSYFLIENLPIIRFVVFLIHVNRKRGKKFFSQFFAFSAFQVSRYRLIISNNDWNEDSLQLAFKRFSASKLLNGKYSSLNGFTKRFATFR